MLEVIREGGIARVVLSRPEVGNAFNSELVARVTEAWNELEGDQSCRVVVVTWAGKHFSAGADLKCMMRMKDASEEENLRDAEATARLFHLIYNSSKAVVARVNGAARAGAVGLIAACDLAVAVERATFGLSEVRIGLAPAVISPFLVRKMGVGVARRLFITGEVFGASEALRWGLVSHVASAAEFDQTLDQLVANLLVCGPQAVAAAKSLSVAIAGMDLAQTERYTASFIARLRRTPEALEGMSAFLEHRDPSWCERK